MTLLFAFLIGFFGGAALAYGSCDDCVGCLPGLAETRAPTLSHWLLSFRRYFHRACSP